MSDAQIIPIHVLAIVHGLKLRNANTKSIEVCGTCHEAIYWSERSERWYHRDRDHQATPG